MENKDKDMGIKLICCDKCEHYLNCIRKWVLGEQNLESECCASCKYFYSCIKENIKARWDKLAALAKSNKLTQKEK
jgi:hypothetical protein